MGPDVIVPVAGIFMIIALSLGLPIVRSVTKRIERGESFRQDPETAERLDRIEQAVDAMAVEVERIAEGQRFVTKVLADRSGPVVAEGLQQGGKS
jgi:hypothetical protein